MDSASSHKTGAGTSLDWPNGKHQSFADRVHFGEEENLAVWKIEQKISGAYGISELLRQRKACFATEARCLNTAWCQTFIQDSVGDLFAKIPKNETLGKVFLCPGVVTVVECELDTRDLHEILRPNNGESLTIPSGFWLALDKPIDVVASESEALIFFVSDESLSRGEISIAPERQSDDVRFRISISPEDFMGKSIEIFQWGCQLSVLSMLPSTPEFEINEESGYPVVEGSKIGQSLALQLMKLGIPLWNTSEWDPAKTLSISRDSAGGLWPLPSLQVNEEESG